MAQVQLTYRGPAPLVSLLAQQLRAEGIAVEYEPPLEQRGVGQLAAEAAVALICNGAYDGIKAVVRKFLDRRGDVASVDLPPPDDDA